MYFPNNRIHSTVLLNFSFKEISFLPYDQQSPALTTYCVECSNLKLSNINVHNTCFIHFIKYSMFNIFITFPQTYQCQGYAYI